ncbi:MAG: hypothetical protein M1828_005905 [Chrysothrix sp. TS-e1954]|nr:MAG: hypothetical protein M1828_005905 [Chrysothrix sp. TS-e1954]
MQCATITDVPVEITVLCYQQTRSFASITSLARTSRYFYDIWCKHATQIADYVLAQTIPAYRSGYLVAEAQLLANVEYDRWLNTVERRPGLVPQHRRIVANNARTMKACDHFLEHAIGPYLTGEKLEERQSPIEGESDPIAKVVPYRDPPYLTMTERERLASTYNRLWAFVTYTLLDDTEGIAEQRSRDLLKVSLADHWAMLEMAFFFMVEIGREYRSIMCPHPEPRIVAHSAKTWHNGLRDIFETFRLRLLDLGHSGILPRPTGVPRDFYIAVFDCHQERFKEMMGRIERGDDKGTG